MQPTELPLHPVKTVKFLDLYGEYTTIRAEIDAAIAAVIDESAFVGGGHVAAFEREFAAYVDAVACVGVGNGTDALEIALSALRLRSGAEVIVPANTFIATA